MDKRPYYPTKAEWAEAEAAHLIEKAHQLPPVPAADWRGVRRRTNAQAAYRAQAARLRRLADRLKGAESWA